MQFQIRSTNRAGTILLGLAAVVVGGGFLLIGLALLAGIAIAGALIGTGAVLYQRLTGRKPRFGRGAADGRVRLAPELEVFSPTQADDRRLPR